jgi:GGDEF domain-containing protein
VNLLRIEDLRERERVPPIIRPPREDDPRPSDPPPRVADGDPRTHIAARATEFIDEGRPFAVLLIELDTLQTLLTTADEDATTAVLAAERALEELLRPGDAIRREVPGRLWLTLPGAGPAGARALALRAAAAVERAASHRGQPLTASVGIAVCPRDGADADALTEHAEDSLLAAQAAGTHGAPPPAL